MHKMIVKNFGPIIDCELSINELSVLIGPQSSGKSTLSKLVYYFLNTRDDCVEQILDQIFNKQSERPVLELIKNTRRRFIEFFGPVSNSQDIYIRFNYSNDFWIEVKFDKREHKYIDPYFSESLKTKITGIIQTIRETHKSIPREATLFDSARTDQNNRTRYEIAKYVRQEMDTVFGFSEELLFIPAGRSLLSTLSDQLQNIHPHLLDYPMRKFIEKVNSTKAFFNKSISEIIRERQVLTSTEIWYGSVRKAENYIQKILKGEFIYDSEGGKIYTSKYSYTKINYTSSGQQESIWILLSLFLIVLDKVNAFVFIEEPEAHLFPNAQKEITDFVAFIKNSLKCKFFLTTHSPYILATLNNDIYAFNVGKTKKKEVDEIVNNSVWIDFKSISAFLVNNGSIELLNDNDLHLLKVEEIDQISSVINNDYEKLFSLENYGDKNVCE